jgi:hypothetical protein
VYFPIDIVESINYKGVVMVQSPNLNNSPKLGRIRIPIVPNEEANQTLTKKSVEKTDFKTVLSTSAPVETKPASVISQELAKTFNVNVDISRTTFKSDAFDRDMEAWMENKVAKTNVTPPVAASEIDSEIIQAALMQNIAAPIGQENNVSEGFYLDDGFGRATEKYLFALEKSTAHFNQNAPVWG